MNQELEKSITSLVDAARSAGQDAYSFIQQQAPDICNQIIKWELYSAWFRVGVTVAGCLILICVGQWLWSLLRKNERIPAPESSYGPAYTKWKDARDVIQTQYVFGWVFHLLPLVILFTSLAINVPDVIKCHVSPKLVLMEQLSRYIHR